MVLWPETQTTLIARLQNADDQQTWERFVVLYRPAIYRFARGQGLQDSDAQDVTQKVLLSVAQAVERWEPDVRRGKFRAWLSRITRNAVITLATRDAKRRGSGRTSIAEIIQLAPELSDADEQWQIEQRIQRCRAAAEAVRPKCSEAVWSAFWFTVVDGLSVKDAAAELGVSIGVVYAARSRVLKRLQVAALKLEQEEGNEDD